MSSTRTHDPVAPAATENPWRSALYRMRGEPLPIYLFAEATLPGASLWTGARWILRQAEERGGEKAPIVVDAPGPRFLQGAVAALFSGRPLHVLADGARPTASARLRPGRVLLADGDGWQPLDVDDLAVVDACPPACLELAPHDWHRPRALREVLRSLVTPTHVLCGFGG